MAGRDKKPPHAAQSFGGGPKLNVSGVTFKNARAGIRMDGAGDLTATNNTFENVLQPYDLGPEVNADIRGTRIRDDPKRGSDPSSPALAKGWTRPRGPPLPVMCHRCNIIFPASNYVFAGQFYNLWDNEETCPRCGNEHAKLAEGVFNLTRELIEILHGPEITYAMLARIEGIAWDAASGSITPEVAAIRFGLISPKLGALFNRVKKAGVATGLFVAWAASLYASWAAHESLTLQREESERQRQSSLSSDRALEQVLAAFAQIHAKPDGEYDSPGGSAVKSHGADPAQDKPRPHRRPAELPGNKKK